MKALIITDGTESIETIALLIKETLTGYKTTICPALNFKGNELLGADLFFIGCEKPSPSSFNFLEKMLSHINLAHKKCALFSVNQKAIKYLLGITKDCEADTKEPFLPEGDIINKTIVKKWVKIAAK